MMMFEEAVPKVETRIKELRQVIVSIRDEVPPVQDLNELDIEDGTKGVAKPRPWSPGAGKLLKTMFVLFALLVWHTVSPSDVDSFLTHVAPRHETATIQHRMLRGQSDATKTTPMQEGTAP